MNKESPSRVAEVMQSCDGQSQKTFIDVFVKFQDCLIKLWPECPHLQKYKNEFTDTVLNNDSKEKLEINKWYTFISGNLFKKVKYCKAVERIINEAPIIYHACEYNDIEGIEKSSQSSFFTTLDIFTKYKSDVMSLEDKKVFWKYVKALNESSFKFLEKKMPFTPTREQIQVNIQNQKSRKNHSEDVEVPSVHKAFHHSLSELCKACAFKDITQTMSEIEQNSIISRWAAFVNDEIENTKISVLCNQKNDIVFEKLKAHVPELDFENLIVNDEMWEQINQMNGYASVGQNIPTKMMGKIENLATKLADDIMSGKADFSNMDLNKIGQEVLSQCDETDMDSFANNIDSLLPALQHFQKQM